MKRAILITFIIIFTNQLYAQKDRENIKVAITGFFNGLSLINSDTLRYHTTPDFHLLEDGEVWNMDTLINAMMPKKNVDFKRINKFEFIRTEIKGNIAWTSYNNSAEISFGEKQIIVKWLESAVLIKNNGRWKIQMLHSTRLE